MNQSVETEIFDALRRAEPAMTIIVTLSRDALLKLACEGFDQRRARRRRAPFIDYGTQQALPGFEFLREAYPREADGALTKLQDLAVGDCLWNAARLRAEAAEWNVPRQRDQGGAKRREAEQLERWALAQRREQTA